MGNVTRYHVGDVMVVRSTRDIAAGSKLCFSYIASEYLSESEERRARRLPFECLCERCLAERVEDGDSDGDEDGDDEDSGSDCDSEEESEESEDALIFDGEQCQMLMMNGP